MKNKNVHKKQNNLEDDELFELELFNALKSYGYLFPKTTEEVGRFEELYGNTEIDTPAIMDLPSNKTFPNVRIDKNIDFDLSLNKAAFRSKKNDDFDLPDSK